MKLSHPKYGSASLVTALADILEGTELISVSLNDKKGLHSFVAYFVCDEKYNLYFMSSTSSRHGSALDVGCDVSLSAYLLPSVWGELLQGIQGSGRAARVPDEKADGVVLAYGERFPQFRESFRSLESLVKAGSSSRPYKIKLSSISITNERLFNRREVVTLNDD